jgi:hypothetical protein
MTTITIPSFYPRFELIVIEVELVCKEEKRGRGNWANDKHEER